MTDIICELLSIKAPQTVLQNKKSYCTKLKENIESKLQKSPGIEFALFNYTGKMGMDNFGYLSSSLSLFLFCNESVKKNYDVRTLTAELLPSPSQEQIHFQLDHLSLSLSVRALWMTPKFQQAFDSASLATSQYLTLQHKRFLIFNFPLR